MKMESIEQITIVVEKDNMAPLSLSPKLNSKKKRVNFNMGSKIFFIRMEWRIIFKATVKLRSIPVMSVKGIEIDSSFTIHW